MKTDPLIHPAPGTWHAEFDPNGKCTQVIFTNFYCELLGYTDRVESTNLYETWSNNIHPDDLKRVKDTAEEVFGKHTEGMDFNLEYRMMTNLGYRWFHDYAHIIRREDGSAIRCDGIVFDIHDSLAEHKKRFLLENRNENNELIYGLASKFTALYSINLDTGMYRTYLSTDQCEEHTSNFTDTHSSADLFHYYVDNFVHPDFQKSMHAFYL